jgi:site-specific recombinase XerD
LLYEASDHHRDYAIIMTFLQTGIRLSELANLTIDDVDLEQKLLTVRQGKGKKDRQIPLVDKVVKALRNYLRYRNTQLVLDDEVLFLAKNRMSLNVSSIKYIVAKYVKKADICKKVSVHTLRHTFGAHKVDKNIGMRLSRSGWGIRRRRPP